MAFANQPLYLGLDAGTSGIRVACVDARGKSVASASTRYLDKREARSPAAWKAAVLEVLDDIAGKIGMDAVAGIAVDGQSGTALLCDDEGLPLSEPLFYNEPASAEIIAALSSDLDIGTADVPATLGRLTELWSVNKPKHFRAIHQADWIAGLFCQRFDFSDENNALKAGYDPEAGDWGFDSACLPFPAIALPKVYAPATDVGGVTDNFRQEFGLSEECRIFTGTTDGTAGFLAASGLEQLKPGTAVTSLGTTMVIKSINAKRVDMPGFGIYSHKLFENWIAGGASNTGGGALLKHFSASEMTTLSTQIDPMTQSDLDYYPLVTTGERFPVTDPDMTDRSSPRPDDAALFLAGLFESIARIEKRGFDVLQDYGVPYPSRVMTVGGGSRNETWLKIRARVLKTEVVAATETEAAYGAALIALKGGQSR
jgi:D-ribulokinase